MIVETSATFANPLGDDWRTVARLIERVGCTFGGGSDDLHYTISGDQKDLAFCKVLISMDFVVSFEDVTDEQN